MKKKFFDEFELVKMSRNSVVVVKSGTINDPKNWVYVSRNAFNKICDEKVVDWHIIRKPLDEFGPVMSWLEVLAWQQ